ncbi:MAG TPA: patatin-like phospholipase family protein, partial [Thermoanaerobaculia bacterium]|nr:patatin-like phospholipase family protein [Thermoanaerobaculia bacterium]
MPRKQCDLVMKGGITSGIVYPRAVCELAKEFTFANIGGTSAGAIAAALTAAAEYRRFHGSDAGFAALEELPEWLARDANLLRLFEPSEETAPLYDVAVRWLQTGSIAATLRALVARFNRFGGAVAALAAVVAVALLLRPSWIGMLALAIVLAAGAIGFVAASVLEALLHASRVLPRNGFGLCSGSGALTQWLDDRIRSVAGVDRPLTFGELTAAGVNLEMMTTNLTHGRPYRLPFSSNEFYFDEAELRRLFPKDVVDFTIARSQPQRGKYLLPRAEDLPVIVAARMSLSFPLLLSAIPLHAIDYGRRDGERAPERCWFSDGGISSNFPVHFFDAPLPRRPTFAINLAERTPRYHAPGQRVYAPRTNRSGLQEWWR